MDALDLSFLEEFERQKIFAVLQRDADLHKNDQERKKKLTEKATRTQNLTIQKKIKMRSGEWFTEMKKKRQTHKKSGTDIVRQSMRRARPYSKAPNQRHRAAPTPPGKQEPMETEPHYEQSQREVQPTATPPSTPLIHKQEYTNETTIMASSTPDLYTRADTSSSDNSTRKHESREKGKSLVKNSDDYYGENNKEDDLQTNSYHSKDNFPIPNTDTILSSRVSNTTLDNSLITTTPTLPVKKYSSENTNYDSDQTEASQSFWKSEYEQFSAQQQPLAINHHNIPDSNYQNYKREEYVDESTPEATPASVDLHSPTYNYPEHSEIIKKRSLESIDENSKLEELSSDVRENNNYKYSENKNNYADMSIDDDQPKVCDSSSNSDSSDSNMSHECSLVALKSAKKSPPLIEVTQASEQSLLEKIPEEEKIEGDDIRQKVTGVESSDSKDSQNDEIQNTFKSTEVKPHPRESTNWFKKHVGRKHGSYDLTPTGSEESSGDDFDKQPMETPSDNDTTDVNLLEETLKYNDNEIDLQNIPKDDENIVSGDSIIRNDESESGSDSETGRPHKKFGSSRRKLRQHYDIEMTDGMSHVQPVTTEYQTTEQIDSCTPEESNSENFKDVSSVVSHHKELPGIALEEFENEYLADSVIESVEDKSAQDIAADLSYSDAGNNEINTEVKSENLKLENVDDATKQAVEEDKGVQSIDEIESENLKLENVDDAKQNVDDATKQAVEEDKRVQSIDDSQEKGKSRKIKRLGSSRRKKAAPLMSDPDECIDGQPPVDDESFAKTIATISESIEKADDENTELSVLLAFEKIEMENKIKSELSEDDVEVSDIFKKVDDDYNEIVEQSDEIKGNTAIEESENVDAYISQEQKAVENLDCTSTDQSKPDDNLIQTSKDSSQIGSQDIDESMELDNPPSEQEKHLADEDSEIMDLPKVVKKVRIVKKTSNREMERPESPMPEIPDDMDNWDSRKNREPRVVKIRRKGSSRRNPIPDFRSLGGDEESPAASGEELPKSPSKKVVRVVKKSAGDGQTKRKRVVVKKKREAEQ